jgi:predicted XRE-type DNA-binding protein
MKKQNKHIGSSFDDFLSENKMLDQCEAAAIKKVLAWQIEEAMQEANISKAELARRMHTSRAGVDRLLNPDNPSITLQSIEKAARAVNRRVRLELNPA